VDDLLKRMTAKQRCVLVLGTYCRLSTTACAALAAALNAQAVEVHYMTDGSASPVLPGLGSSLSQDCVSPLPVVLPRCCSEHIQHSTEVHELLSKKTAKEQAKLDQYRSHGTAVSAQCEYMTKEMCMQANNAQRACRKMHKRCAGVQQRVASLRAVQRDALHRPWRIDFGVRH
jgi:hypothetical protein